MAHYDFVPRIQDGRVTAAGVDDENGTSVNELRVAGYDFGENAFDPYNIGDPGFNTGGPSAFAGGTQLRLAARAVDGRFLSYWNGVGTPAFGQVPAGVTIDLAGSPTRYVTFGDTSVTYAPSLPSSLLIGSFTSAGAMHIHLGASAFKDGLQEADSVATGAYLIAFDLVNRTGGGAATGVADSLPFYAVFNNGLIEARHDDAIAHVQAAFVPEPASLAVFGVGGLLFLRRR